MAAVDEHELISRFFRPLAGRAGTFDLTDDAASLAPPDGCDLVLTKDGIAAGYHFLPDETPGNIARKALRVNLSDLAAKGARPLGYLMLLGLGARWEEAWLSEFTAALAADQSTYGIDLLGGDTIRADGLVVSITAIGTVPKGAMVRRSGARPGDRIYVTGTIGDAALGLLAATADSRLGHLDEGHRRHLLDRYSVPQPRTGLADALRRHATAALDVSDGLAGDLDKLCKVSGVGAAVDLDHVPLSPAVRAAAAQDPAMLELAVTGGDDYEILCAIPPEASEAFEKVATDAGTPVTAIGEIRDGEGPAMFHRGGTPSGFSRRSFSHTG
ncbi:thiamine-phosphate kinase [Lutibaculum baratangense]|uniref:Thiamine-monophosphate kinase n=1 Tax=Lutibaculum baratangense AMV1 TaxID=631454 RepID=V4RAR4_9HYPH|nr:thiamine-phosphate kinase [Lutibaculum baratangense]ESR23271.1 Thiamine-monophosphate kinase [Lutibaculum baratangense AMV1]